MPHSPRAWTWAVPPSSPLPGLSGFVRCPQRGPRLGSFCPRGLERKDRGRMEPECARGSVTREGGAGSLLGIPS